jgi:hypothetical protein
MAGIYNTNNSWVEVKQNASRNGFNEFDQVEYKPDPYGIAGLSGVGIDSSTRFSYAELIAYIGATAEATATIDGDGIVTDLKVFDTGVATLTEKILIRVLDTCSSNYHIVKWLNSNGAWEYEYFERRAVKDVDVFEGVDAHNPVFNSFSDHARQFSADAKDSDIIEVFKNNIKDKFFFSNTWYLNTERYMDFKRQALKHDVFLFEKKFVGNITITDYSATLPGCCLCTMSNGEPHKLQTGDYVFLKGTYYDEDTGYQVFVQSDTSFAIVLVFEEDEDNDGYFQKKIENKDWKRCKVLDFKLDMDNFLSSINISMKFQKPING